MTTYISMLRGINVGGQNKIKMETLRQLYAGLGFSYVQSYIQSGNVIFQSKSTDISLLEKTISAAIRETFGLEVPVLILTVRDMEQAVQKNPYRLDSSKDPGTIHLTFLSAIPEVSLLEKISSAAYVPDEFRVIGKVIYIHCPEGYGRTKLTNTFFENKLKLKATSRNLKTATELTERARNI